MRYFFYIIFYLAPQTLSVDNSGILLKVMLVGGRERGTVRNGVVLLFYTKEKFRISKPERTRITDKLLRASLVLTVFLSEIYSVPMVSVFPGQGTLNTDPLNQTKKTYNNAYS